MHLRPSHAAGCRGGALDGRGRLRTSFLAPAPLGPAAALRRLLEGWRAVPDAIFIPPLDPYSEAPWLPRARGPARAPRPERPVVGPDPGGRRSRASRARRRNEAASGALKARGRRRRVRVPEPVAPTRQRHPPRRNNLAWAWLSVSSRCTRRACVCVLAKPRA